MGSTGRFQGTCNDLVVTLYTQQRGGVRWLRGHTLKSDCVRTNHSSTISATLGQHPELSKTQLSHLYRGRAGSSNGIGLS